MNKSQFGQVGIWTVIITSVASIFSAGIVGYYTKSGASDAKLEVVKAEQAANVLAISQRVTAQEIKVDNLQSDVKDIKTDVRELLRRIK